MTEDIINTPWDSRVFGFNTFEIFYTSDEQLKNTLDTILQKESYGHYTIKINPLASKKILHEFGFYYCDTLIEPYCHPDKLVKHRKEGVHLSESVDFQELRKIVYGSFIYDRFHRDFNIESHLADMRYDLWLQDIWQKKQVFALMFLDHIAGFWAYSDQKILLHTLSKEFRGQGLSKYFWSVACEKLFTKGYPEITSSISVANVPVLNLYSSLGFNFRNPVDIYHLFLN